MSDVGTPASGGIAAPTPAAPAPSPSADTQTQTTTAAPAAQGTPASGITDSTEREGYIPRARFDEVNTRMTQAEARAKEYERWQWLQQANADPDSVRSMFDWYGKAHSNPVDFALGLVDELSSDQTHAQALRSHAARLLRAARGAQPEPEIEPDIPVYNNDGQEVNKAYSGNAVKQLIAPLKAQIAELQKQLSPISQRVASDEQREQSSREAQRIKSAVIKLPKAEEHWKAIQLKAQELARADRNLSAGEAVRDAYAAVVLPTLGTAAQAQVLSDLQTKATAQTANPGSPGSSAKPKFKNFEEAASYYAAHPEEAQAMANR